MKNEFLRHTLSAISYRFQKAVRNAKSNFGAFYLGKESRTPEEVISHMHHVLYATRIFIEGGKTQIDPPEKLEFNLEIARFNLELKKTDELLSIKEIEINYTKKLLQGPFADVLTHIGQVSMLRRLSGDPTTGEDFSSAPIETGII